MAGSFPIGPMIVYNGATGGLGQYLGAALAQRGLVAHAIRARMDDISGLVRELDGLKTSVSVTFIHLAAKVSVPECEAHPAEAYRVNVGLAGSTLTAVLDWAEARQIDARVVYVSTGHVYAKPTQKTRVSESALTSPRSVYARTKLEAEHVMAQIASARGASLLIARVFGLIAPNQAAHYILPGLIRRVRNRDVEAVPGLDYTRDYLDSRDVCANLARLVVASWQPDGNLVNVCSGVGVTIRDLLREVAYVIHPSEADDLASRATAGTARAADVEWLVGDPTRLVSWTQADPQRISRRTTIADAAMNHGGESP